MWVTCVAASLWHEVVSTSVNWPVCFAYITPLKVPSVLGEPIFSRTYFRENFQDKLTSLGLRSLFFNALGVWKDIKIWTFLLLFCF